jgi:hypothetical protein
LIVSKAAFGYGTVNASNGGQSLAQLPTHKAHGNVKVVHGVDSGMTHAPDVTAQAQVAIAGLKGYLTHPTAN